MVRQLAYGVCVPVVWALRPVKLLAWRTRWDLLRRAILEVTTPIDWAMIWLVVQNNAMLLHWRVYGGNFVFGKAVMVTDHATTAREIARPAWRGNHFMGVDIVASDSCVFATNAGILNQCPPIRASTRAYLDQHVFTAAVPHDLAGVREATADLAAAWKQRPDMAQMMQIRTMATRLFLRVLSRVDVPHDLATDITAAYVRRFVEASLFSRYFPTILGLLGTRKAIRRDAYLKLAALGVDVMTIDITLFAAMFSVGTLVLRVISDLRRFGIAYRALDDRQKLHLIVEAQRLYPTVTTVHRLVEEPEVVRVCGRDLRLEPGDEVAYPFVCSNRDPSRFPDPERMDLDRPADQYDAVLSWSKGPHACPAKDLSIAIAIVMLDTLSDRFVLEELDIFDPQF